MDYQILTEMTTAERMEGGCLFQFKIEKKSNRVDRLLLTLAKKQQNRYLQQPGIYHVCLLPLGPILLTFIQFIRRGQCKPIGCIIRYCYYRP